MKKITSIVDVSDCTNTNNICSSVKYP